MGGGGGGVLPVEDIPLLINVLIVGSMLWKFPSSVTMILILVICISSVLEGIAVGVADSEADAWSNLWTTPLYKILNAIGMGIQLTGLLPKRPFLATIAYLFAFLVSTPVGVAIGVRGFVTTQVRVDANWIFGVTVSAAAGIYIYGIVRDVPSDGLKLGMGVMVILLCVMLILA